MSIAPSHNNWLRTIIKWELPLLWIVLTFAYTVIRSQTILIWDDTPSILSWIEAYNLVEIDNFYHFPEQVIDFHLNDLLTGLADCFAHVSGAGYRPMSMVLREIGLTYFVKTSLPHYLWFCLIGMLIASMSVSFILVSRFFLRSRLSSYYALFIFLFSSPIIIGGWVVFAGIQVIVPLLICCGLLLYWKLIADRENNILYALLLCLILFIGPWFREFVGILPILIIIQEFQRVQKPTKLSLVSAIFFMHAVFPTALSRLLFPNLPLKPVFSLGFLGAQISSDSVLTRDSLIDKLSSLNWDVPFHFFSLFPPLLLALIVFSFLRTVASSQKFIFFGLLAIAITLSLAIKDQRLSILSLAAILYVISVIALTPQRLAPLGSYKNRYAIENTSKIFQSKDRILFLVAWFLLSFLPFLKVFTSQVHLAYAVAPASILITISIEKIWDSINIRNQKNKLLDIFIITIFLISSLDHALNLKSSYIVTSSINNGIVSISRSIASVLPEHPIILANFLHLEDIRLRSGQYFDPFWTLQIGVPHPDQVIDTPDELRALLNDSSNDREIYFLAAEFDYPPEKSQYHPHKFIRSKNVSMEDLGIVHVTQARYTFLDPFKSLFPRTFISFLGSPDLENDFYRGPARDGTLFMREVYAEYHLYRVTGTEVDPWLAEGPLTLVEAEYKGFNILELNSRFFAIPQGEGDFDLQKIWDNEYSYSFVGDSREDIAQQIEAAAPMLMEGTVTLVESGYKGFNILELNSKFFAIPQGEGDFDPQKVSDGTYSRSYAGDSREEIIQQINAETP